MEKKVPGYVITNISTRLFMYGMKSEYSLLEIILRLIILQNRAKTREASMSGYCLFKKVFSQNFSMKCIDLHIITTWNGWQCYLAI